MIDNLGGDAYVSEQTGQLSGDKREFRLRVHDELLECDGFRHFQSPIIAVCERMYEIDVRLSALPYEDGMEAAKVAKSVGANCSALWDKKASSTPEISSPPDRRALRRVLRR